jgi:hypothetical protein
MTNPVVSAIDTAQAVGMYIPISSSPNFSRVISKIDPYLGHTLEFLRQFASEESLLEYKTEWVESKEEEIRRNYGSFGYLTPMSNTFIVDKDITGKYLLCYASEQINKLGSYTLDSSFFYKSDVTKVVKPTYKELKQDNALLFALKFSEYLDFYDKVSKLDVIEALGSKWQFYTLEETHPSFPSKMPLVKKLKASNPMPGDDVAVIRLLHLFNDMKELGKL